MINDDNWYSIEFGVDLVTATLNQISFLKQIDGIGHLYEGYYFERALYRYEHIWIPLLAETADNVNLIPPIDVQWVWHVHMLAPVDYINDCRQICGKVLNHYLRSEREKAIEISKSKLIWERFSNVPYNYLEDFSRPKHTRSKIDYDLHTASLRQKCFLYQVSLPHYENTVFLSRGVDRYKKFLYLKKFYEDIILPCFLIDLIWHSHQLHPLEYFNNTNAILGYLLTHNGTDIYHVKEGSFFISDERVRELWRSFYNEEFFQSGTFFRGLPMNFSKISTKTYDPNKLIEQYGVFELESVQLNATNLTGTNQVHVKEFKVTIYRMLNNKKDEIFSEKVKTRTKCFTHSQKVFNFTESIPESLQITVKVEGAQIYKKRSCHVFTTKISIAKDDTMNPQIYQFKFLDEKSVIQFTLIISFRTILQLNRRVTFYLLRKEFIRVGVASGEKYMSEMFTPLVNMLNVNSVILKARHKIIVANHGDVYDLEVLNVDDPPFSSLKVLLDNQVVATSKVIGLEQLLKDKLENCISLDIDNERAMLVQHAYGDYAIIKARYLKSNGRISKNLRIQWYSLQTKTSQYFNLKGRSFVSIINPERTIKATMNLKTGFIYIELTKRVNHFEAFLAGLFSVTYLYVFIFQSFLES